MAGPSPHLQPTVEDYHSDDSENNHGPVLESFRRSPAANVAAKRSHPSDLGLDKSPPVEKAVNVDVLSDSGYSTVHSAMSSAISSADSATSVQSLQSSQSPPSIPPTAPSLPPPSPVVAKRRPTITDDRKVSSQSSPRKPQRSGSVAARKPKERRPTVERGNEEDCTDPNCTECMPAPLPRGRKPNPSLLASVFDDSYNARSFDQRSQRSDPAPSYISSPHSPTYSRPAPYMQGSAVIMPAQSARRRSSSTTRAARPLSYHGGDPGSYWSPALQAPPYSNSQEPHGPPPSMSARFSMQGPMGPYMPPPQSNYFAPHPMQPTPQYDSQSQRPQMQARAPSYNPRGYGAAVVMQENTAKIPSARYAPAPTGRQEQLIPTEYESESSEYASSDDEEPELYSTRQPPRAIMPPPPVPATKASTQRRPSLRHAATTQVYNSDRRMSQSQTLPVRPREPDPRERSARGSTGAPSRSSSVARPALVQHPKAQSAYESTRNAKIVVQNSKSQRHQSYQGYDRQYEETQKRRANRNSKVYGDDEIYDLKAYAAEEESARRRANRNSKIYADDEIQAPRVLAVENKRNSRIYADDAIQSSRAYSQDAIVPTRRRQTDSDLRRREDQIFEAKNLRAAQDAEAYQRNTRGSNDPLIEKVHKAAKRASRAPTGLSHAESSQSSGSGKASRVSHHTTVTNGNSGEIRLRVDASAPLSLQFNGDMDGRTVHIEPMEDGMADIVIGNPGSQPENMYRNEKINLLGSSRVPKAIMPSQPQHEVEEFTAKSQRGGRREGERRVLQRRRRDPEYD